MSFVDDIRSKKFTSLEQVIPTLRSLRDCADEARAEFIRACMALEDSPLWKGCESPKAASFGGWLEHYAHLCGSESYERESAALRDNKLCALVPQIGIKAAAIVGECPKHHQAKLISEFLDYAKEHPSVNANGMGFVNERAARGMRVALVGGKERESAEARTDEKVRRLVEENKALKAKVRELESEVTKLRKRLGKAGGEPLANA